MKKIFSLLIVIVMMVAMIPSVQADEYMNVWAPDGRSEMIKTADFDAWHAVGWYSAPVMYVYALDGRCELILKSNYYAWSQVGWYDAPKMYVYSPYNQTKLINKSDFDYYHANGWYSAPVMYVYAPDGRKQLVLESDAPAWKAVGWDYQTGYADNIPWTSDDQYWAAIDLDCGPYSDWHQNRNYYIDKYFIEMPEYNRTNIKHYDCSQNDYGDKLLFIPRYKTTTTVSHLGLHYENETFNIYEGSVIANISNGTPFSITYPWPARDGGPMFKAKTYSNGWKSFEIFEDLSDEHWQLKDGYILDLTEWQYSPW